MKRRTRINYTPEQKAIIWDRYKQGDSLHDIARVFDRYHSSIMPTIHQTGGYRPPVRKWHRLALSLDESEEVSRELVAKLSIRDIAAKYYLMRSMVLINKLDHLVLTCRSIEQCKDFYTRILDMKAVMFNNGRWALLFGDQKINLHEYGKEIEPKTHLPVPGSHDLCFIVNKPIQEVLSHLKEENIHVLEGPVTSFC